MKLPAFVKTLLEQLEANGFQAFVVGGCVRNSLLNLPAHDWDICTDATPDEMISVFKNFTVIPTGIQHGTVTVLTPYGQAEITTFRTDGAYLDNRHPESVSFVTSIKDDLARRDFTVNAMAYSPSQGLVDPFGGQQDLIRRYLRCVGDPIRRFQEDALRILRALRFSTVYDLRIEDCTASAMLTEKDGLNQIARERVFSELKKILSASKPGEVLSRFSPILTTLLGSHNWDADLLQEIDSHPPVLALRFATLFRSAGMDAFLTLKPDNQMKHQVRFLLSAKDFPVPCTLKETRQAIRTFGLSDTELFLDWKDDISARKFLKRIKQENLCCTIKQLAVNGNDLITFGVNEGTEIAVCLSRLLDAVIDEKIPNEKKALMNYLFL